MRSRFRKARARTSTRTLTCTASRCATQTCGACCLRRCGGVGRYQQSMPLWRRPKGTVTHAVPGSTSEVTATCTASGASRRTSVTRTALACSHRALQITGRRDGIRTRAPTATQTAASVGRLRFEPPTSCTHVSNCSDPAAASRKQVYDQLCQTSFVTMSTRTTLATTSPSELLCSFTQSSKVGMHR